MRRPAINIEELTKQLPDLPSWTQSFYSLWDPLDELMTCNDPEVTTPKEWKAKASSYSKELAALGERLRKLSESEP